MVLGEMGGVYLYDNMIRFAPVGSVTGGARVRTSSVAEATEVCGREEAQEEVLGVIGFVYFFLTPVL